MAETYCTAVYTLLGIDFMPPSKSLMHPTALRLCCLHIKHSVSLTSFSSVVRSIRLLQFRYSVLVYRIQFVARSCVSFCCDNFLYAGWRKSHLTHDVAQEKGCIKFTCILRHPVCSLYLGMSCYTIRLEEIRLFLSFLPTKTLYFPNSSVFFV
jgi:hypothetical protein